MIFDGLGFLKHNIKSTNNRREMDGEVTFIKVKGLHLSRYRKKKVKGLDRLAAQRSRTPAMQS